LSSRTIVLLILCSAGRSAAR